ncbi:hypothetical protein A9K71_22320 [Mesorhizobium sp. WSM3873]|nr:hypothetical protein A9K71_22320 [Mesorhizobium sp. WSM3873]
MSRLHAGSRADLDPQVSLLSEHTKRLAVHTEAEKELKEWKRDVAPEAVLNNIKEAKGSSDRQINLGLSTGRPSEPLHRDVFATAIRRALRYISSQRQIAVGQT